VQTLVIDHPLVTHKVTALRDAGTETATFRRLTDELVTLLAYEATREIRVQPVTVQTPLGGATGVRLGSPPPLIVPVLRAGIGMLDGMIRLLPMADVGFVGLVRDEESLVASTYADRLPADLTGREAFVLDPMLATGGTLQTVIAMLVERGVTAITAVTLLAAPEGLKRLEEAFPGQNQAGPGQNQAGPGQNQAGPGQNQAGPGQNQAGPGQNQAGQPVVRVVTAAVDDRLDENGYIYPGLGDAGDRLFGEV
jgi:uracil phosphoribosyltransferase